MFHSQFFRISIMFPFQNPFQNSTLLLFSCLPQFLIPVAVSQTFMVLITLTACENGQIFLGCPSIKIVLMVNFLRFSVGVMGWGKVTGKMAFILYHIGTYYQYDLCHQYYVISINVDHYHEPSFVKITHSRVSCFLLFNAIVFRSSHSVKPTLGQWEAGSLLFWVKQFLENTFNSFGQDSSFFSINLFFVFVFVFVSAQHKKFPVFFLTGIVMQIV